MFGIGKKNLNSSMTPIYLFLFILITNQFIFIHSFVVIHNDQDQNQLENLQQNAIRRLVAQYFTTSDSSSDDNDLLKPTVQRRFCCMSVISGRKRSIRDLAKQQQQQQLSNELNQ